MTEQTVNLMEDIEKNGVTTALTNLNNALAWAYGAFAKETREFIKAHPLAVDIARYVEENPKSSEPEIYRGIFGERGVTVNTPEPATFADLIDAMDVTYLNRTIDGDDFVRRYTWDPIFESADGVFHNAQNGKNHE